MKYYENNGSLYTSNAPITNEEFIEITQEEYDLKLSKIKVEQVLPSTEDECISELVEIAVDQ